MTVLGSTQPSPGDDATLSAALRSLAPDGVEVQCRAITEADIEDLHPSEAEVVERAISRRRSEFASGRALLKTMLATLAPIPRLPNGAPQLPADARGSLAHDSDWVVAAITRRSDVAALGIDIEPDSVLTRDEQALIVSSDDEVEDPLLTFVQKEAVYKAWSSLGGRFLDHHEVVIRSGPGKFSGTVMPEGRVFNGHHDIVGGRRIALVVALVAAEPQAAG